MAESQRIDEGLATKLVAIVEKMGDHGGFSLSPVAPKLSVRRTNGKWFVGHRRADYLQLLLDPASAPGRSGEYAAAYGFDTILDALQFALSEETARRLDEWERNH